MDAEDVRLRMNADAHLIQPVEFLEPLERAPGDMMEAILGKCEGGPRTSGYPPHLWFGFLRNRDAHAFYGSALRSLSSARDVDMLFFAPMAMPQYHLKPGTVHLHGINTESWGAPDEAGLFLSGPLLFLSEPPRSIVDFIGSARSHMLSRPFFDSGVGELITHAALKALEAGETKALDGLGDSIRISVRYQWLDCANMMTRVHSPHEQNNQVRAQMQPLRDEELYSLALAGMRRIRVKAEERKGLAERFVKELRAKKIHGPFG